MKYQYIEQRYIEHSTQQSSGLAINRLDNYQALQENSAKIFKTLSIKSSRLVQSTVRIIKHCNFHDLVLFKNTPPYSLTKILDAIAFLNLGYESV